MYLINMICTNCFVDIGNNFDDESFTIDCPSGCIEDLSSGNVYGTEVYTEVRSLFFIIIISMT